MARLPAQKPEWFDETAGVIVGKVQEQNQIQMTQLVATVKAENDENWERVATQLHSMKQDVELQKKGLEDLGATQREQAAKHGKAIQEIWKELHALCGASA